MKFKTNKDNKDYITINRMDLPLLAVICQDKYVEVSNEALNIFSKLNDFGFKEKKLFLNEFEIRKDSLLGKFFLNNPLEDEIINDDLVVDYTKVVNAFNIAVFQNNEIAIEILSLFQNPKELNQKTSSLERKYGKETIHFILENNSFEDYLKSLAKEEPKKYFVYEDNQFYYKELKEKGKVKTLTKEV